MANYPAAYQSTSGSALDVDRDFYKALAEGPRELITSHLIPIRTGFAWEVPAGHLFRITTPEGPQVGDLNIWNRRDPRERMWYPVPANYNGRTCRLTIDSGRICRLFVR